MKTPEQLRSASLARAAIEPKPAAARMPRPGSDAYWLERDATGRTYSVFRYRTLPAGVAEITCILDGSLYQGARECVLKHTVEESARAVEREYA